MGISDSKPFASVVLPVKNAEKFLPKCLESLNNLDYPKERYEVIVSDSDSRDRTRKIASSMGAKVVKADGESVCAGRNSGFRAAKGDIVAFSDADCVMDRSWLSNAIKYFEDKSVACVGGPSLIPEDETAFGKACGFVFSHSLFTGGSTYGLKFDTLREVPHNPGCNAIYRREALERVMPVDEKFIEGEDVIMNRKLKDMGYRFLYTPDTKLWHYRSSTARRFWRQNIKYGIGRVLLGRTNRNLINPMHITAGFSIPIILIAVPLLWYVNKTLFASLIALCSGIVIFFSLLALIKMKSLKVAVNVPFVIFLLLSGWSLGFMKEVFSPSSKKETRA